MANSGNGDQNHESTFFAMLIVMIAAVILFHIFKEDLINIWRTIRLAELYPFRFLDRLPFLSNLQIESGYQWLVNTPASQIDGDKMRVFDEHYGVFRYLFVPVPAYLGYRLLTGFNNRNRSYDMEILLARMANWPKMGFLKEFLARNPGQSSIFFKYRGRNEDAAALTPAEFAEMVPPLGTRSKRPIYDGEHFDKELARLALNAQLGKAWRGRADDLNRYQTRLFNKLMDIVIKSGYQEDLSIKDAAEKAKKQRQAIMRELNQHAFINTMFTTLFELSKGGGVTASLSFRWVKKFDRTLWYCLSSLGRKTPFVESAGCHAHWELERAVKMPIPYIETQMAVEGLEFTIFGPKDEEEDPTYS